MTSSKLVHRQFQAVSLFIANNSSQCWKSILAKQWRIEDANGKIILTSFKLSIG